LAVPGGEVMRLRVVCQNCHAAFDVITHEPYPAGEHIKVEDLVGVDNDHRPSMEDLEFNFDVWMCKKCADAYNSDDDRASLGLLDRLVRLLFPKSIDRKR